MSTIQPTDVLLVNRAGVDYHVAKSAVMATVQDSDLLLVNRAGVDYKATFSDVKKGFGPQWANPKPGDVSATPAFAGGTGTQADPFIITPSTVSAAGGTAQSAQQLTISGLAKDDIIEFLDKSTGADTRFKQPIDLAPGATWTGHLVYSDAPPSTGSTAYTGNLQIGTTYFRWVVTQETESVPVTFAWNAETDAYTRDTVDKRIIDIHVRIRRCLLTDAGAPTYLDADDSTKLAGDWLRLCETTELNTPYTGTHGAEVANTALRAGVPAWAAGTYTKGQRVTNGGSVWECIAASTTATPTAGATAATLSGGAGQVMVEIPRFSVWHQTAPAGSYQQHTFHLARGTKVDGGYAVHPAFVKPDNSYRDFIYVGAYQGTGTNGNGSASGVNNTTNFTRATCRTACSGRGAGWHQLGYWDYNALQWLLITEYQDMNSQKVLGNGSMAGRKDLVPTGVSNARGNRSANVTAGSDTDYVSYRGVENFYGRAWQWVDGINMNDLAIYLSNNPAQWADDTATNYTASGSVPTGGGSYQRDVMSGIALLPSSMTGASDTTFIGDSLWTDPGWRVAAAGGVSQDGSQNGAFYLSISSSSSFAYSHFGGRLAYSA